MHISAAGLALIKRFEGYSAVPYRCAAGYLTIGYGHVILPHESFKTIDEDVADRLLRQDVRQAEAAVRRMITVPLRQGQTDALVSFTFNLGGAALQRSTLRRLVNREAHAEVPEQFLRWVFAGGKRLAGLLHRRTAEARMYQGFLRF